MAAFQWAEGTLKGLIICFSTALLGQGSCAAPGAPGKLGKHGVHGVAVGNCLSAVEKAVLVPWDVSGALGQGDQQVVNSVFGTNLITAITAEVGLRPN